VLDEYDCFVVGEAPMMDVKNALRYVAEGPKQELDMMFHFEHMGADCLFTDYVPIPFSLRRLKSAFTRWQHELDGCAWNALYIENHDHPRIVSRYGSEEYREKSAMTLAASYLFQKGTPFVYQGQEIGMVNTHFASIDEVPDVSAKNQYAKRIEAGDSPEKAMELINRAARDHARTPVQWSGEAHAGFCPEGVDPWLAENPNYPEINVERDEQDPDSVLNFYRKAINLRKHLSCVRDGNYKEHFKNSRKLYVYSRQDGRQRILVVCSFSKKNVRFSAPAEFPIDTANLILCNYHEPDPKILKPYECRVYLWK
jgi:oligo-1,6-glucosidase